MPKRLIPFLSLITVLVLSALLWGGVSPAISGERPAGERLAAQVRLERTAPSDPAGLDGSTEKSGFRKLLGAIEVDKEAVKLYAKWVIGAPVLVVAILIAMLLRPRRTPEADARHASPPLSAPRRTGTTVPKTMLSRKPSRPTAKLSDQQQVLRFFLQLFKRQQGADPDAPAQLVRTEMRLTCPNETYEMRILQNDEWVTRRMSIGMLGQGGGSRSRCFYVIYDSHMVIKIPPVPMNRFSDYKRQIAAEGRIVDRLAPRPCIVPRVSVILKAVHSFADCEKLSEEVLEEKYVRLLQSDGELQEHLKIDDSFAFFMDLAKHCFLSATLEEIHSGYHQLMVEARQHPELLWDQHGFICRYGEAAGPVCQALQDAYYQCENQMRDVLEQVGASKTVPTYHLKQWFLSQMAGESLRREEIALPAETVEQLNRLLAEVVRMHRFQVDLYRRHLTDYIRETRFSQHRRQLESLATNMLDLLAWIGQRGLALRDLKPENLFVAGNPDDYPVFLNHPDKFSIGLIDVETAVFTDAEDPILIPQPQLAGTPLYATPTHLMSNAILLEAYEDLPTILHLQDWFATIAIIFKVVSGENLFATTAHVFPEILNRLKVVDPAGPDLMDEVIRINRLFWNSAVAEFQTNMAMYADLFARVDVTVPQALVGDIADGLKADLKEIESMVGQAVSDQSFFSSGDKRRYLKEAPAEKIGQMRSKLTQEMESGEDKPQHRGEVLLYFELLERLKARLEKIQQAEATLKAPSATITADQLLDAMFQRVFTAMYPARWPALAPELYGSRAYLTEDITTYQATM